MLVVFVRGSVKNFSSVETRNWRRRRRRLA